MQFAIQVLRRKRDAQGQPMTMPDGEACHEFRHHPIGGLRSSVEALCRIIGIAGELRDLMNELQFPEMASIEIPRRAISALTINVPEERLNTVSVAEFAGRDELIALRDARLEAGEPEARCFLVMIV
jgi:hypothetical protein